MRTRDVRLLMFAVIVAALSPFQNCGQFKSASQVDQNSRGQQVPKITFDKTPAFNSSSTSAEFAFHADVVSPFVCNMDGTLEDPCVSPVNIIDLADGPHTFMVSLKNNPTVIASYGWTVDTMAPTLVLTAQPPAVTSLTTARIDFVSSDALAEVKCSLDSQVPAPCTSPIILSGLSVAAHSVEITATDLAKNKTTKVVNWTVNLGVFTVEVTEGPKAFDASVTNSFKFRAIDSAGTVQATTFQCAIDAGAFSACGTAGAGNIYSYSLPTLADGAHSLKIKALQLDGSYSSETVYNWVVDTVAPEIYFSGYSSNIPGQVTIQFSAYDSSGLQRFDCTLKGKPKVTGCSSGISFSGLTEGAYPFTFKAYDNAGNAREMTKDLYVLQSAVVAADNGSTEVDAKTVGSHLYMLTTRGLAVYNLADSGALLSFVALDKGKFGGEKATAFTVFQNRVYVSSYSYFYIYDYSDVAHPQLLFRQEIYGVDLLFARPGELYAGTYNGELLLFDVSSPAGTRQIKTVVESIDLSSWAVTDKYIISVSGGYGKPNSIIRFIDIDSTPAIKGQHTLPFVGNTITIKGDGPDLVLAHELDWRYELSKLAVRLIVYDLSNVSAALPIRTEVSLPGAPNNSNWTLSKGHVYLPRFSADGNSQLISIFNIEQGMVKVGDLSFPLRYYPPDVFPTADANLNLKQVGELDIETYSLANAAAPTKISSIKRLATGRLGYNSYYGQNRVTIKGDTGFITTYKKLNLVNLADPKKPAYLSSLATSIELPDDLILTGNNLYIIGSKIAGLHSSRDERYEQWDISNPRAPVLKNSGLTNYDNLFAKGNWLLRFSSISVTLYDMSQTSNPIAKNSLPFPDAWRYHRGDFYGTTFYVSGGLSSPYKLLEFSYAGGVLVKKSEQTFATKFPPEPFVNGNYLYLFGSPQKTKIFEITTTGLVAQPDPALENVSLSYNTRILCAIKGTEKIFAYETAVDFTNPLAPTSRRYFGRGFESSDYIGTSGSLIVGYGDGFEVSD